MQNKKTTKTLLAGVAALLLCTLLFTACGGTQPSSSASGGVVQPSSAPVGGSSASGGGTPGQPNAALPTEMRAMWISFLEWETYDLSTEEAMRSVAKELFGNCANLGLNTVIVQVRSFSDAMYPSEIYPWSHQLTGTQGQDPGYDPLAVMIEEAHALGLRFEAWVNPYRAWHKLYRDLPMAADNPAVLHPEWTREGSDGGLWYNAGIPEVKDMIVAGTAEIVQNYDVDGIHYDDYFYSFLADENFDADLYAQNSQGQTLAGWRRQNVNYLLMEVYQAIKNLKPGVAFGISPQGNNENNYNQEYSDVKLWMEQALVDYVMPQLYWGFNYRDKNGKDNAAFANKCAEWAGYPRSENVALYIGLGAYRIGAGDGGSNDQSEWQSGHNIADMVTHMQGVPGITGFALFRYAFLFDGSELAQQETAALTEVLMKPQL